MWRTGNSVAEIRRATSASYDTTCRIWNQWEDTGDKCPDRRKPDFALWTREALRQSIKQEYGMDMLKRTVRVHVIATDKVYLYMVVCTSKPVRSDFSLHRVIVE